RGLQCERRRPGGRGLHDREPGPIDVVVERELDLALLVPLEREPLLGLHLRDGCRARLAVPPAERRPAARPPVELDVVREPLLELPWVGERGPDLLAAGRKHDLLANHLHTSLDMQPNGCATVSNRLVARYRRWSW